MSPTLLAVAALGAVLLFWVIGAYNRLVALRNDIGAAWVRVHETLQLRNAALAPLVGALREPMAAEQGALDTWLAAHADAVKAAASLASKPVSETHAPTFSRKPSSGATARARNASGDARKSSTAPGAPNQPRRSASRWRASHPSHVTMTTPRV